MQHPKAALAPEYVSLMAHCVVKNSNVTASVAARLLRDFDAYKKVQDTTGVPVVWLMATNERESSGNLRTYLGNGEPLNRTTRLVPRGRGPFDPPDAWTKGAIDALTLDRISQIKVWDWPTMDYEWELWNGFGYRDYHHEYTPYLWGGTSVQMLGKYTGDGHYDSSSMDTQLGTVAIARAIVALRPDLDVPGWPSGPMARPPETPAKPPVGVGGGAHDTIWVQHALNQWGAKHLPAPDWLKLLEDNDFGRVTRRAVYEYQEANGLTVDGVPGPETWKSLEGVQSVGA